MAHCQAQGSSARQAGAGSEAEATIDREASVPPVSQEGVVDIFAVAQCHLCLCLSTSKE